MEFAISSSTRELAGRVRTFVDREVIPLEGRFFAGGFAAVEAELLVARDRARHEGLWAPQLPKKLGGLGLSLLDFGLVSRELGRSPLGHFALNCQAPDAGNMEVLAEFGNTEQKAEFLAPLVAGRVRSCFAMTEPERAGSNPVWMGTTARREGDEWVLDGLKWFTSAAEGAAFSLVMAVTDPEAPPRRRASLFLVPLPNPGFEVLRNLPVMGEAGTGWASHAEVRLDGCRVPARYLLGEPGDGFKMAQARLGPGRIHHCMRWLGICERSFDLMCQRALARELAPGEVLADKQLVQGWIADSRAEISSATLLVLEAAWKIDTLGAKAAREEVSLIKFHTARVLGRVVDRALQAHGALGMTDRTPLAYFYRQERAARIYDGPDEVHQSLVAREVLKRYGGGKG